MSGALAVALGAALGALARWRAGVWLNTGWGGFPLGTLLVNLVGGLLIGMALEYFGRAPNELLKLLLVTGFLGGLTTFSAFSGESLSLLQRGEFGLALAHSAAHVLGSLAAAALGMKLLQLIWLKA
ncbi:fluoride efflux transporter CrcB [Roseateles sp. DAIF2]|uniref:fluoride efflux transporter CrcB n=1 Tax=Roseateles sp. DAIF2 TaxID=2714952 RepID=UPI0018A329DD|nr:fluoride efflux transporter CrcB [Roseateles sp. DAIF2]QPF74777.1 fluoride efflux transporter CrcB [Roseateles sp. DAIF2]